MVLKAFILLVLNGLTQCSNIFKNSYGFLSFNVNQPSDSVTYTIAPAFSNIANIVLAFTQININAAQMLIYDTSFGPNSVPVYTCSSCSMGQILPPIFSSSTGSVTVFFSGVQSGSFTPSSFSLQYVSSFKAMIPNIASAMQYALLLSMPYTKINPILVGGVLPAKASMSWTINVPVSQVIISISRFNFGSSCGARLSIYTTLSPVPASLAYSGCTQADIPRGWIYAPNGQAVVVLTGGAMDQSLSFTLTYVADASVYHCGSLTQPDVQYDDSMIITDGSASSEYMRRAETCAWSILPSPSLPGPVTLQLLWVSLMSGSSVTVYDGTQASGRVLWSGVGPTTTTPPPMTSLYGTLYIVYASNTQLSTGYYGFRGQYFRRNAASLGMGSRQESLSMSSVLSVTPAWTFPSLTRGGSLGVRSSSSSAVTNYTWSLVPQSAGAPDQSIIIVINSLQLVNPSELLTIRDGGSANDPVLYRRTGPANVSLRYWLRTSGSTALFTLTTVLYNSSLTSFPSPRSTLDFSYYSDGPNYHCGFPTNSNGNVTGRFLYLTDGSSSTQPMFPGQNCVWTLTSSGGRGAYLAFDRLDLRGASLSVYVSTLSSANLWLSISDISAVPAPLIVLSSQTVYLVFKSESSAFILSNPLGLGFAASYFALSRDASVPGDGTIRLRCPSLVSLTLPPLYLNYSRFDTRSNLTWIVRPSNASAIIYLTWSYMNFPNCSLQHLTISYGSASTTSFCGPTYDEPPQWIRVTSGPIIVKFITSSSSLPVGPSPLTSASSGVGKLGVGFDITYYSDGAAFHCGFSHNPAVMKSHSMMISDGSAPGSPMFAGQQCEWLLQPRGAPRISGALRVLVIDFVSCDLKGAAIDVYDGTTPAGPLLWHCSNCSQAPVQITSHSGSAFLRFSSLPIPRSALGQGFRAVYWTMDLSENTTYAHGIRSNNSERMLVLPADFSFPHMYPVMTSFVDSMATYGGNVSAPGANYAIRLDTNPSPTKLRFYPTMSARSSLNLNAVPGITIWDGRPLTSDLFLKSSILNQGKVQTQVCGTSTGSSSFFTPSYSIYNARLAKSYFITELQYKSSVEVVGYWNHTLPASYYQSHYLFSPAMVCRYVLKANRTVALDVLIKRFDGTLGGSLYVYGGGLHHNELVWRSELTLVTGVSLRIPCGAATVILQYVNASQENVRATGPWKGVTDSFGLEMDYWEVAHDNGGICSSYIASLVSSAPAPVDIMLYLIIAAGVLFVMLLVFLFLFLNKNKDEWERRRIAMKYGGKPVAAHPKYRPLMDRVRNKLLLPSLCCICQDTALPVMKLKCRHGICIDDLKAYITAGLQDISKFPLKCPMHYEGCEQLIGPLIARRFLSASNYERFLDFMDRATLGEGVRCIFCANFVKFSATGKELMVECTYCVRRFCMRCRKPWHYTIACPLEAADDLELQNWKAGSGAQKCPGCSKLIEKEDPDTCNHMVHKITDSIPCVRTRTDFCYLCGVEVTGDYPHEEVSRPGVNHFPKGVFQCCLTVIESELKEELLREKARRKPKVVAKPRTTAVAVVHLTRDRSFQSIRDMEDRGVVPSPAPVAGRRRLSYLSVQSAEEDKADDAVARAERNPSRTRAAANTAGQDTTRRVRSPTSQLQSARSTGSKRSTLNAAARENSFAGSPSPTRSRKGRARSSATAGSANR